MALVLAVPTGTPIPDLKQQLHAAAERVLLRDGAAALTSRAVTSEAGLAKGILYRRFPDFDTFLATLVLAHIEHLEDLSDELRGSAGTATVPENVSRALDSMLDPLAIALVVLICSRRPLLARLRLTTPVGVPLLAETTKHLAAYLTAERGLGRIELNTDVDALAVTLVGAAYLTVLGTDPDTRSDLRPILRNVADARSECVPAQDRAI